MALALTGARLFDGDSIRGGLAVIIEGKRISAVVPDTIIPTGVTRQRLRGGLLAPGFIDVQVNGGGGALLNANPTAETVRRIASAHRKFGTTGLLPTVITDTPEVLAASIAAVKAALGNGVLGIHMEGPFLDVARKGAHEARFIREVTQTDVTYLGTLDCGVVMLTVAPNRVHPAFISALTQNGVLVSLGHADASFAEAQGALAAGACGFTHLFNAMSQMSAREPGMVGAALADLNSFTSLIADGHHVHNAVMAAALAARPKSRMMLITDAMPTAAGGPDSFELQGRSVRRNHGRLELGNGTLAGSDLTMDQAVRHCVTHLGVSIEDALRMAALNPACFIKQDHALGRVKEGYLASLVHLDDDLRVVATWVNGA